MLSPPTSGQGDEMKRFDLISAIKDPKVLKPYFTKGLETWKNWITFFKVLSGGYKLSDEEMEMLTAMFDTFGG